MPIYFFHIRDNGSLIKDTDGVELPGLAGTEAECKQLLVSLLQEEQVDEDFASNREFQIEDERGETVLVVPFGLALSSAPSARGL